MLDISDILIGTAHAQGDAGQSGGAGSLLPLIIIFFIFYILLIRPQQKKIKEHEKTVEAIKRNDKIVTAGGIVGTVSKVNSDNETIEVKIASGVEIKVMKTTVASVITKSESPDENKEDNGKKPKKKK